VRMGRVCSHKIGKINGSLKIGSLKKAASLPQNG